MRGLFDALAGAVRRLGLDPVDGHRHLFLNERRRLAKALCFDSSGWCVRAKRLEAGTSQLPALVGWERQVRSTATPSRTCWQPSTSPRPGGAGSGANDKR